MKRLFQVVNDTTMSKGPELVPDFDFVTSLRRLANHVIKTNEAAALVLEAAAEPGPATDRGLFAPR